MPPSPATIRDVAKAAKVSAATVSRYLNKTIALPAETAARIERACKRLRYRPNQLAKQLSRGSSELIGLVTSEIANPFFATLAAAAERQARHLGYSLLIMGTGGDARVEAGNIDRLDSRAVDGLIVLTDRADDGLICERISGRADVVLIDEDVPGADVAKIFVENEEGAYQATRHLIELGHRRIAHVGGPRDLFSARERAAGFSRAMAGARLPVDPALVSFGGYDRETGRAAVEAFLGADAPPTALFAGSDYIALGALQGLRQAGREAPRDLSLVSFDDMPFAELLHPPLTTVRQPITEMGRLGVETLIAQLRGQTPDLTPARLPTELVIRGSAVRAAAPRRSSARLVS
jgi:LacI family transcriptional regulator